MVEYNNSADVGSIVDEAVKYCKRDGRKLVLKGENPSLEQKIGERFERITGEPPIRWGERISGPTYVIDLNKI